MRQCQWELEVRCRGAAFQKGYPTLMRIAIELTLLPDALSCWGVSLVCVALLLFKEALFVTVEQTWAHFLLFWGFSGTTRE